MAHFCINNTGKNQNIYSTNAMTSATISGTLKAAQVVVWIAEWGGNGASGYDAHQINYWVNGALKTGWVRGDFISNLKTKGQYSVTLGGKNCAVFQTKQSVPYYNTSGTKIGNMPKDCYIATSSATAGSSNKHLMYVDFWGPHEPSNTNVFIDTGVKNASTFSNLYIR